MPNDLSEDKMVKRLIRAHKSNGLVEECEYACEVISDVHYDHYRNQRAGDLFVREINTTPKGYRSEYHHANEVKSKVAVMGAMGANEIFDSSTVCEPTSTRVTDTPGRIQRRTRSCSPRRPPR